jgi:glucose/arabinose dehydrogenase
MTIRSSTGIGLVLAGSLGALVVADWPVLAQQAAAPAKEPPPSWAQGRPSDSIQLAPVVGPPIATAADKVPVGQLKVPKGFNIEVYATGMANARSLRQGDKGTVFAGSRLTKNVYAVIDKGDHREVKVLYNDLYRPNGLAYKDGTLYIAELSQVSKVEKIEDNLDNPPKPTVIYSDLPKDEAHGWKFIGIGPDNKLYVPVGQPCNNCLPPPTHGQIRRINLDGSGAEVVARGVRNTVGFDWRPGTGQLYFTDNGRDWLSEDKPEDELNRLSKVGEHFGSPYCYEGDIPDQEFGWGHSCSEFTAPVAKMGPHSASLGMRFYTGHMFPSEYHDQIFVARHGSWNRSVKFGGDVVVVKLNKDGTVKSITPFLTGFIVNNNYIGRPVDVLVAKDGALLVSDDWNGVIYRITYGKQKLAGH